MKQIIAIMLCLSMLFGVCACGSKEETDNTAVQNETGSTAQEQQTAESTAAENAAQTEVPEEPGLTLSVLSQLQTREELADAIGIQNPEDLKQLMVYLKHFSKTLPSEGDSAESVTEWGTTEYGYSCLTLAQAKALVTPTVVTTENWKEFLEPGVRTVHYNYFDENDNEIDEYLDEASVGLKEGCYAGWSDYYLELVNNVTGEELTFTYGDWPEYISLEDGVYYASTYDYENDEYVGKHEFSLDNYTCTFADYVVYQYELPTELQYVQRWNEDSWEYDYYSLEEAGELEENDCVSVFIQYGSESYDWTFVDCSILGNYVYDNDLEDSTAPEEESETIETAPAESLDLNVLSGLTTKEELCAVLGIEAPDKLDQMVTYLDEYSHILPSENDTEASAEFAVDENGRYYMTLAQAKTMISPIVLTTENWKDYVSTYMNEVICISYDDQGNEITEIEEEPAIGIDPDLYYFGYGNNYLLLKNNDTGNVIKYELEWEWPEQVDLDDGTFYVTTFNDNGFGIPKEFNIENYSCLKASGVIYTYDLAPELLYEEYYDEAQDDWIVVPEAEYQGSEEERSPVVYVQTGDTQDSIWTVGVYGLGQTVYFDNY